jgi:hypothetical protein
MDRIAQGFLAAIFPCFPWLFGHDTELHNSRLLVQILSPNPHPVETSPWRVAPSTSFSTSKDLLTFPLKTQQRKH